MTYNACGLVGALCPNNLAAEQEPVWSVLGVCLHTGCSAPYAGDNPMDLRTEAEWLYKVGDISNVNGN